MYARLRAVYDGVTPWDPVAYVNDLVAVACGETNSANLTFLIVDTDNSGELVTTLDAGWFLETTYESAGDNYWILSSVNPDNAAIRNYLKLKLWANGNGFSYAIGDAFDGIDRVYYKRNNKSVSFIDDQYNRIDIASTSTYDTIITSSANHIGIWTAKLDDPWFLLYRRTRLMESDTADDDFCAWGALGIGNNGSGKYYPYDMPLPRLFSGSRKSYKSSDSRSDQPNSFLTFSGYSPISWYNTTKSNWRQLDDTVQMVFGKLTYANGSEVYGSMLDQVPIYPLINESDAPATTHGLHFVLESRNFVVVPGYECWSQQEIHLLYVERI